MAQDTPLPTPRLRSRPPAPSRLELISTGTINLRKRRARGRPLAAGRWRRRPCGWRCSWRSAPGPRARRLLSPARAVPGTIADRDFVATRDLLLLDDEATRAKQRRRRARPCCRSTTSTPRCAPDPRGAGARPLRPRAAALARAPRTARPRRRRQAWSASWRPARRAGRPPAHPRQERGSWPPTASRPTSRTASAASLGQAPAPRRGERQDPAAREPHARHHPAQPRRPAPSRSSSTSSTTSAIPTRRAR